MAPPRKTYWHLGEGQRLPSDYEIATSRLLYYVDRGGFAVDVPASEFYRRHQQGSALVCERWETFADPRATTYATYVEMQRDRENYVGRLLTTIEESSYDGALRSDWINDLAGVLSPARFLFHGLQMVAAYVGQMAPSGRVVVAALFQSADEIRRLQRTAHRIAQLRRLRPEVAEEGRARWQSAPAWQPFRRVIEKLLCAYDWGEALVVLNCGLKPVVDDGLMIGLAHRADRHGDYVDAQILRALFEDCVWHRQWSEAALKVAVQDRASNREVMLGWLDAWKPLLDDAAAAAGELLGLGDNLAALRERARRAKCNG